MGSTLLLPSVHLGLSGGFAMNIDVRRSAGGVAGSSRWSVQSLGLASPRSLHPLLALPAGAVHVHEKYLRPPPLHA